MRILEVEKLRYTPSGVPVLELYLEHHSDQDCAWGKQTIHSKLKGLLFGSVALSCSLGDLLGRLANISGLLHQYHLRRPQLVVLIQTIDLL